MSRDTENFEQLCRLLKLKRYEQPPPAYFHHFSSQVIARIRQGETAEDSGIFDRMLWESTWLQRVFSVFEAKPVLAGAFGVAMCALLVSGVIYSDKADVQPVALIPVTQPVSDSAAMANEMARNHPFLAQPVAFQPSSTNPIAGLSNEGPLFNDLQARPATLQFLGNN